MARGGQSLPVALGLAGRVFNTVDRLIKARGGQVQVGDLTLPAFSLNRKTAVAFNAIWLAYVDFAGDGADFNKVQTLEEAIEDAISRECMNRGIGQRYK